jgi:hypothetical protein
MDYYIDTEFIEGFVKPTGLIQQVISAFGYSNYWPVHSIRLISIGITAEDGRTYYAISNEFNPDDASEWVRDNVFSAIIDDTWQKGNDIQRQMLDTAGSKIRHIQRAYGKSTKEIAADVVRFILDPEDAIFKSWKGGLEDYYEMLCKAHFENKDRYGLNFYGYYSDYDWVAFCSLFGTMMQLPKSFPKYCRDLKQMLDEAVEEKQWFYLRDCWSNTHLPGFRDSSLLQKDDYPASLEQRLEKVKTLPGYPYLADEHHALKDAIWNFKLHDFIKQFKTLYNPTHNNQQQ